MKKRIITGTSTFAQFDSQPLELLKEAGYEVVINPYKRKLTRQELVELLPDAVGVIAGLEEFDREILKQSSLKVISRVGAGISNIDLQAAQELGIKVCNTPDAPTNAVAELTIAGILNVLRQIPAMDTDLHNKKWKRVIGTQLKDKTVVIVGYGRIGRRVAQLLKVFDCKIIVVDPFIDQTIDFPVLLLSEALPKADILTFHCSGEDCILSENEFAMIKPTAVVCNVARGGLIDEGVLIDALESKKIAGCWLDTFSVEPYEGRLIEYPQAVLTPHIGSFTRECRIEMEIQAAQNLIAVLNQSSDNLMTNI